MRSRGTMEALMSSREGKEGMTSNKGNRVRVMVRLRVRLRLRVRVTSSRSIPEAVMRSELL